MKKLAISRNLSLPPEAVTQTFGVIGKRGSGKTSTAVVLAEELYAARLPAVIVDPVGVWYGLRLAKDGKGRGLDVVILGGPHGDLPLEPTGGATIADLVVDEKPFIVVDLSALSKRQERQFMTDFLERLYRRNRSPLHVVIDEADMFAPQRAKGMERLLGAMEDLVRRGRARGLGCTYITQRPAVLHKDVLTQTETLVALRLTGPQDRDAVDEWVKLNATSEQRQEFLRSLAKLRNGEAWFWSPEWLGVFQRVQVRRRRTFDSSATPKVGTKATARPLPRIDLEALRAKMAETIERQKADDPGELKRRIAELERELRKKPEAEVETERVPVLEDRHVRELTKALGRLEEVPLARIEGVASRLEQGAQAFRMVAREITEALAKANGKPAAREPLTPARRTAPAGPPVAPTRIRENPPRGDLRGPEQRILDGVAWWEAIGVRDPPQVGVGLIAGYTSTTGGAFQNPRGALHQKGLVEYLPGRKIRLTDAGREVATFPDRPGTVDELQARVLEQLTGPEERIVRALLRAYPDSLTNEDLARSAGYTNPKAGAYQNPRGHLRTLGLIEYPSPGVVRASPVLLLET